MELKYFETYIKQVTRNIFLTTEGYKIYSENSNFAVDGDKILAKYNINNNKYYVHKILEKSNDIKYGVVFYNKKKKSYCIRPFSEYTTYYLDTTEHISNGTILEFTYSHYDKKRKVFVADIITEFDKNTDATSFKLMPYKKEFNEKVINEVSNLSYTQDKNRVDLTSDNFISFENITNAYSFESTSYGYRLKITIPDISLIKASTYTNNDAYQRGFGVVLDKMYNIIPDALSNYIVDSNNVLCLIINMNHLYETINYCFVKAVIDIKKRFTNDVYLTEIDNKFSKYYAFLNNMCIACKIDKQLLPQRLNDIANTLAGKFISQNNILFIGYNKETDMFDTTSMYATITDPLSSYISIMNNRILHNIIMDKQIGIADIENDCDIMNALYRKSKDTENWFKNKTIINKLKNVSVMKGIVTKNDSVGSIISISDDISGIIFKNIKVGKYINVCLDIENSLDKIVFKIV